jgi:IS30 family transposase
MLLISHFYPEIYVLQSVLRQLRARMAISTPHSSQVCHSRKKSPGPLGRGRGGKLDLAERQQVMAWIDEACAAGARHEPACAVLGLTLRSVQRWVAAGELKVDGRQAAAQRRTPANALTADERAQVLALVNRPAFADLSPQQIVPRLADQGEYLASESTIYRILRAEGQLTHRGQARPPTHRRPAPPRWSRRVPIRFGLGTSPTWRPQCGVSSTISI